MTCGRWYTGDTLLERLAQDLEDMARARGQLIQAQEAVVRQRDLPRQEPLAAADHAYLGDGVVGVRKGRVVTTAVRPSMSPATPWTRVMPSASKAPWRAGSS
jgi:hypothetical protein